MDCFSFDDFSMFMSALRFCADKHRSQRRKDLEKTPYLNHPVEVAELLWRVGGVRDLTVLTSALLHDVIEDTETEPGEIEHLFGKAVLDLVLQVSDDKSLPKVRRKELQIVHAPNLSEGAKLIKIGDKICNVRDVTWSPPPHWPPERRIEYIRWAGQVVDALGPINAALEHFFREVVQEAEKELGTSSENDVR